MNGGGLFCVLLGEVKESTVNLEMGQIFNGNKKGEKELCEISQKTEGLLGNAENI